MVLNVSPAWAEKPQLAQAGRDTLKGVGNENSFYLEKLGEINLQASPIEGF